MAKPMVVKGQWVRLAQYGLGTGFLIELVNSNPRLYLHKGGKRRPNWWGLFSDRGGLIALSTEDENESEAVRQAKEMGFNVVGH